MKKNYFLPLVAILLAAFFLNGCNNASPAKEQPAAKDSVAIAATPATITNPNFSIAPAEYATLSETALSHMANFEFDAWGEMMADNIPESQASIKIHLNHLTTPTCFRANADLVR